MRLFLASIFFVALSGCTSDPTDPASPSSCSAGTRNCVCYGNGTCGSGLECSNNRCIPAAGDDSGDPMQSGDPTTAGDGATAGDGPNTGDATSGDSSPGDSTGAGDSVAGSECGDGADCRSGICTNGWCIPASSCADHAICSDGQYCHFPSSWTTGTMGTCADECTGNPDCDFSQDCIGGRCYTNKDCDPANPADCPPGEVCNRTTRLCTAPPANCYFDDQCPSGWLCDTVTSFTCYDPSLVGATCSVDADCDDEAGCGPGVCDCFDGGCQVTGSCDPTGDVLAQCGAGSYCAGDLCRPAVACTDQASCTPYALVCDDPDSDGSSHCLNPPLCQQPGNTCADGAHTCRTSFSPPICLPTDNCECVRDDQCPAADFCDLSTCSCTVGCRDDAGCFAQCGGAASCYCGNDRACSTTEPIRHGELCSDPAECEANTTCTWDDPAVALTCEIMPTTGCTKRCLELCSPTLNQVTNTCPAGYSCSSDSLIADLIQSLFGGTGDVSACYEL